MGLACGIVGLPNVGKSTLFNCLSSAKAQAANFPFCTIEPNLGVITVPDNRLGQLAKLANSEKLLPATMEIFDIAGLVKGASKGEGLGNKFLSHIRNTDAIIHVLRCFDDPNVTHVDNTINPVRDRETIDIELQMKDLETIEGRMAKVEKAAKVGDKDAKKELEIILRYKQHIEQGKSARTMQLEPRELELTKELHLLTDKPVLYVCNVDEKSLIKGNHYVDSVREAIKDENAELIIVATKAEAEIAELESAEEREMFLADLGLKEPGVNSLIRSAYKLLNLETYFTVGPKEARAWTYKKGTLAPQAAGIIHTDFEKGFIRAEVIKFSDYMKYTTESACRDAGKIAVEGKEYIVQDGDVMHFRFNV